MSQFALTHGVVRGSVHGTRSLDFESASWPHSGDNFVRGRRPFSGHSFAYGSRQDWTHGTSNFAQQLAELTTVLQAQLKEEIERVGDKIQIIDTPFPDSRLYVPNDGKPDHPGIILLHGSEGGGAGFNDLMALALSKEGFAVMAYSYYGSKNTPKKLANIDIAETMRALEWLNSSKHTGEKKVGLWGGSRGAEQALLIASLLQETDVMAAVAAHAPNSRTVAGFDPQTGRGTCDAFGRPEAAWCINNTPYPNNWSIEIENFQGPVFITHGMADELWPASHTV